MGKPSLRYHRRIVDVRDSSAFVRGHLNGAVNIPLAELPGRVHELPPKQTPLEICGESTEQIQQAIDRLSLSGRKAIVSAGTPETWPEPLGQGESRSRLWQPATWLTEAMDTLNPPIGEAMDLACGSGRNAIWLALQGWRVTGFDLLDDALDRARSLARHHHVHPEFRCADLQAEDFRLQKERADLVIVFYYLHRPLLEQIRSAVRPGGAVIYETFTTAESPRIRRPGRLFKPGELRQFFSDWDLLAYRESPTAKDGSLLHRRNVASLLARKPNLQKTIFS